MNIGIEKISFYVPRYYLDLKLLAKARDVDEKKYYEGLGQHKMGITPPNEDVISMGASAAYLIFKDNERKMEVLKTPSFIDENSSKIDKKLSHNKGGDSLKKQDIDLVIFCTESCTDQSKAGSIFIHNLLELSPQCSCIEIKQACYSSTAALHVAYNHVVANPKSKVLVIASDIARYDLSSPGEATQGAGAVAFIISNKPKILEILPQRSFITKDVNDFWRPNYSDTAFVDGRYSIKVYQECLIETFKAITDSSIQTPSTSLKAKSGYELENIQRLCFHLPFTKIAEKSYKKLCLNQDMPYDYTKIEKGLEYNRQIGNSYTASLYISLISMLELDDKIKGGDLIGFFAYGSGCVAEFFLGRVMEGYKDYLYPDCHKAMLESRTIIDFDTYIDYYEAYNNYPIDGSSMKPSMDGFITNAPSTHKNQKQNFKTFASSFTGELDETSDAPFILFEVKNNIRFYTKTFS